MWSVPRVSEDHLTARREQILAAARTCFLRNGLHSTSMQDLIREADLSVGAVYRYFKSKNDIINAIAVNVAGGLQHLLEEIAATQPPLPLSEAVQVWAEATLDPSIGEIVRVRYTGMRSAFETIARNAVASGDLPADADPAAVATTLFGMMPGYALQRLLVGNPDKETYLAGLRALLSRS
jgi:AcrR family transcriptional regulator